MFACLSIHGFMLQGDNNCVHIRVYEYYIDRQIADKAVPISLFLDSRLFESLPPLLYTFLSLSQYNNKLHLGNLLKFHFIYGSMEYCFYRILQESLLTILKLDFVPGSDKTLVDVKNYELVIAVLFIRFRPKIEFKEQI